MPAPHFARRAARPVVLPAGPVFAEFEAGGDTGGTSTATATAVSFAGVENGGMSGAAEQALYRLAPVAGDFDLAGRLVAYTGAYIIAGAVWREGLGAGDRLAGYGTRGEDSSDGARIFWRATTGGEAGTSDRGSVPAGGWFRLKGEGAVVRRYRGAGAPGAVVWTETDAEAVAGRGAGHAGFVCAKGAYNTASASFDEVTLTEP